MFNESEEMVVVGGKWEDEEERRFYEDVQDLKDYVPSSVLGIDNSSDATDQNKEKEHERMQQEKEEFRQLEEELQKLQKNDQPSETPVSPGEQAPEEEAEWVLFRSTTRIACRLTTPKGANTCSGIAQSCLSSSLTPACTSRTFSIAHSFACSTSRCNQPRTHRSSRH